MLIYSFARISAALAMRVEDYFPQGKRWWLRLHEKGGKHHEMPVHHSLEAYLDEYVRAAGIAAEPKGPLFRAALAKNGGLSERPMGRKRALETTHAGIMRRPLSSTGALAYVQGWLEQPYVEIAAPGEHHWPILRRLLEATGAAGNLTADAHIAAIALERGAAVYSCDHDFARFPGLKHVDPLTG